LCRNVEQVEHSLALLVPLGADVLLVADGISRAELRLLSIPPGVRCWQIPKKDPGERGDLLLAKACGEWILWLEDDEDPETEFLGELGDLVKTHDVTHYLVPVRPYAPASGDGDYRRIPSFQARLFRNDPPLLQFPGLPGRAVEVAGPTHLLSHGVRRREPSRVKVNGEELAEVSPEKEGSQSDRRNAWR